MNWSRTRRSPIGLEVTPRAVRLLQIEWRGEHGTLAAAAEIQDPAPPKPNAGRAPDPLDSETLAAAVRAALKAEGFTGTRAVPCVPPALMLERHVKVESVEGPALHDALMFELEGAFQGDAPIVQYLEVGEVMERGERRHELILLAAGMEQVRRLVTFVERCGLVPLAIDVEGCAVTRTYQRRRRRESDAERHAAIVHVGDAATQLTISAGGRPLFMKVLPLGAQALFEAVERKLELPRSELVAAVRSAEAEDELAPRVQNALRLQLDSLALELSACMRYHAATRRSQNGLELILSGAGALLPGLSAFLGDALGEPLLRADPLAQAFAALEPGEARLRDPCAWSVPIGLALREEAA